MINTMPLEKIPTSCAVTGHRNLDADFSPEKLYEKLIEIYNRGYDNFLIGMAKGFDTECFLAVEELKKQGYKITTTAVVPCENQDRFYSDDEKIKYREMLNKADYLIKEERNYFKGCMLLRNRILVDNSTALFAYFDGRKTGGTHYTVAYAIKNSKRIFNY